MKKLILIICLCFMQCGNNVSIPDSAEAYTPNNEELIQARVLKYFELDSMQPSFYIVPDDEIGKACGLDRAGACYKGDGVILVAKKYMNRCGIIAHELTHYSLDLLYGKPDVNHDNPVFGKSEDGWIPSVAIESKFCEGIKNE